MLYQDLFEEMGRLQRELQTIFDPLPTIRGMGRGGYPALNIGNTPGSVEVYAFAPGLDPASIDVSVERGVLSLSGERKDALPARGDQGTLHINERFSGAFRRVISLPEDIDPGAISASYRDGVLRVSLKRSESAQPRRIEVK